MCQMSWGEIHVCLETAVAVGRKGKGLCHVALTVSLVMSYIWSIIDGVWWILACGCCIKAGGWCLVSGEAHLVAGVEHGLVQPNLVVDHIKDTSKNCPLRPYKGLLSTCLNWLISLPPISLTQKWANPPSIWASQKDKCPTAWLYKLVWLGNLWWLHKLFPFLFLQFWGSGAEGDSS